MKNKELFFKLSSPIVDFYNLDELVAKSKKTLFLPFYHTVSDSPLAHISNLYPLLSTRSFENQLDELLKHFTPIDFNELQTNVLQGRSGAKPSFHLTFDDGLKELQTVIAPLLLRKGIPATFFICPAFVDNKTLFYRHLVSVCIGKLNSSTSNNTPQTINRLQYIQYADREELLDIAEQLGVFENDYLVQQQPYLSTDEIIALDKQGFTIGAHSYDHPLYEKLSLQAQLKQTISSIEFVSKLINKQVDTFSFPFTDYNVGNDFFVKIKEKYPSLITFGTAGLQDEATGFHHLQRFPMEVYNTKTATLLKKEYLYYAFKKMIRKNTIHRN